MECILYDSDKGLEVLEGWKAGGTIQVVGATGERTASRAGVI